MKRAKVSKRNEASLLPHETPATGLGVFLFYTFPDLGFPLRNDVTFENKMHSQLNANSILISELFVLIKLTHGYDTVTHKTRLIFLFHFSLMR